jgi:hypothetical protein
MLFIKLFSCYLEHLDSLGLRHAKRLKSKVGGYTCNGKFEFKKNLCCVRLNMCSLFRYKQDGMASVNIAMVPTVSRMV